MVILTTSNFRPCRRYSIQVSRSKYLPFYTFFLFLSLSLYLRQWWNGFIVHLFVFDTVFGCTLARTLQIMSYHSPMWIWPTLWRRRPICQLSTRRRQWTLLFRLCLFLIWAQELRTPGQAAVPRYSRTRTVLSLPVCCQSKWSNQTLLLSMRVT